MMMEKWEPIDTAPKDKEIIVCDASSGWTIVASWSDRDGCGFRRLEGFWMSNGCVDNYLTIDPTHWMPLPEPPK